MTRGRRDRNGNGRRLTTPRSADAAIEIVCGILRRPR